MSVSCFRRLYQIVDIVEFTWIEKAGQLDELVRSMETASRIGFDTEFVSEDSYFPHLCLIQVKVDQAMYIVDPLVLDDVTPFWQALIAEGHETVAHAAREELRFCLRATGKRPNDLFDTQIAAGLIGMEYPAAYSTLISKVVGKRLAKGETRTDWRKRPLTKRQVEYALQDVVHLDTLHDNLSQQLAALGREDWLVEEMQSWQDGIEEAERQQRWRRVSGIAGLSSKQLAIVREVWRWRDAVARELDRPAKRVLRDDLIIELARRESADRSRISAIRGFERRNYQRHIDDISASIQTALDLPEDQYPPRNTGPKRPALSLLGQFLSAAMSALCREKQLAPGLVGGVQDVRDLVCHQLKLIDEPAPKLARGWRAEVVGNTVDKLLKGQLAVQVDNPLHDQPLKLTEES